MNATIDREAFFQGQTAISLLQPRLSNPTEAPCSFAGAACTVEAFSPGKARALCFRSEWGREMTPVWRKAAGTELAVTAGRSSHGWSPFLFLRDGDGSWLWVALCHSGNWRLRLTEDGEIRFLLDEAMLHPFGFSRDLTALGAEQKRLVAEAIAFYRREIAPILGESTVRMRTAPPLRTTPERAADDGRRLSPRPGPWALELVHPDKTVALTLCGEGRAEMTVHKTK